MNSKLFVFLVTFFILFLSGCISENEVNDVVNTELSVGITRNSTGYYPYMRVRDTNTITVNINIFNSLVKIDQHNLGFKPALATDWFNPDNLTWRFLLREGVKFHNGENFTAEDVKFTLEFLKNYSYTSELLQQISEIEIIDDYTIDMVTFEPYPNLLNRLLTIYMMPMDYMIDSQDLDDFWPIGTGAYKLVEDIPGKYIILERFDDYWSELPDVEKVIFKKYNSSNETLDALKNGNLDIISISHESIDEISNFEGLKVLSANPPNVVYISFDFRENGSYGFPDGENPTSDVKVRRAIYHAINISFLIESFLDGVAEPVSQFITQDLLGYNPDIQRLPYDLDLAKEYMKEAGYEAGFNINFDAPDTQLAVDLANEIKEQLSLINITVIPNFLESSDYYINLYFKNTSFYVTSMNHFDAETSLNLLLQTSDMENLHGVWNYGNYSNEEVDLLIDSLSYTMNINERKNILQEAFFIANEDVAWVPLYSSKYFYGVRDDIDWNPRPSLFLWVEEVNLV